MPRILAIDYGQKRTGIAVTDELQIIASGLTTIPSATAIAFLKDYFSKEKVEAVLIGEPKQMNGQPSGSASIIKGFVTHFTNHLRNFGNNNVTRLFDPKNVLKLYFSFGFQVPLVVLLFLECFQINW